MAMGVADTSPLKKGIWVLGPEMGCSRKRRGNKVPYRISVALVFLKLLIRPDGGGQSPRELEIGEKCFSVLPNERSQSSSSVSEGLRNGAETYKGKLRGCL